MHLYKFIVADFPLKSIAYNSLKYNKVTVFLGSDFMIYKRIRDLREDKDLTQREMGEILMCSQRVYSNYERGDLDIPTEILIKLADFHNVSVDYILNRTDVRTFVKLEDDKKQ